MVILQIILGIIIIAAVVGIIAFFVDLFHKSAHKPFGPYERFVKRPLDAFLSTGALIVFSPLLLLLTLLGAVMMKGNPFFTQERPGLDESIFKLIKFRTMTNAKDKEGNLLPDEDRLIPYGVFLRNTSLDELPELINIVKGDMSVVGPRPLLVQYLPYYTNVEHQRHVVRPGLTGLAQVNGRNLVKWDQRLAYDIMYVNSVSLISDARIVFKTVRKVFAKDDIATDTITVEPYLDEERKEIGKNDRI